MGSTRARVDLGYRAWGEQLVAEGWSAYLLTFMFRELGGSDAGVRRQMEREVERVYALLVTRIVRKPTAPSSIGRLPIWFCSPDRPVFKHAKQGRWDAFVNDGRHMHAVAFIPPWSRLRDDLVTHFLQCELVYVQPGDPLIRVDVQPITERTGYVVGYARKHIGRGLIAEDATMILPKSFAELRGRTAYRPDT
ncbi:hypothetical protein MKK75_22695 [Methylobacterium sp. J-030]|uniref:hypothetical protein n=1 Tax=Methylobacterium sp. J-030 TaxID=2836627 RepID=UPI001FBADF76|nr:hypothetical protein [Methylobacterium sp. J-030]MCJ2071574.1 hypothetical protein [Methylobacterium sp. J-030]